MSASERPVHVMHLLYMLGIGGMEVGVVKLGNLLPRSSVVTSICSSLPADGLKYRLSSHVGLFEFNRRPGNDVRFVAQLTRLLRERRPDVLHTHGWGTLCEGLMAARMAGVPFVVHGEHGTLDVRGRTRLVQRWAWNRCDRVLSVSSRLAERMAAETGFPVARIQTIRNGVDLDRFEAADRTRGRRMLGLDETDLVIGTVGRLVTVKDHHMLLSAAALLHAQRRKFRLVLVGDGVLRETLQRRAAELGITDLLCFAGHQENVPDALAAMDVFVLSSSSEGLSNTIAEAMATGLPTVATHVGGADELVTNGETGLLVPARNPAAMAAALDRLIARADLRASMGAAARLVARAKFSVDRMVSEYDAMYQDVARRGAATVYDAASAQV